MQRQRTKGGVHDTKPRAQESHTNEEALLLKTNDHRYLLSRAQAESKKVERLRSSLQRANSPSSSSSGNTHIFFTETPPDTPPALKRPAEGHSTRVVGGKARERELQKRSASRYRELEERSRRAQRLHRLASELDRERSLMVRARLVGDCKAVMRIGVEGCD